MNCKPGDLAVIICGPCAGTIVHVLRLAPPGVIFRSRAGRPHAPVGSNTWEIKSAGQKLVINRIHRETGEPMPSSKSIYGCIDDRGLRPIRPQPDDAKDETLSWLKVPDLSRKRELEQVDTV